MPGTAHGPQPALPLLAAVPATATSGDLFRPLGCGLAPRSKFQNEVIKMTFRFNLRMTASRCLSALTGWLTGRGIGARNARRADSGSPWQTCPGVYALLVDVHRNR